MIESGHLLHQRGKREQDKKGPASINQHAMREQINVDQDKDQRAESRYRMTHSAKALTELTVDDMSTSNACALAEFSAPVVVEEPRPRWRRGEILNCYRDGA